MSEPDGYLFDLNIRHPQTGELKYAYETLGSEWKPPLRRQSHDWIQKLVDDGSSIGFSHIRPVHTEEKLIEMIDERIKEKEYQYMDIPKQAREEGADAAVHIRGRLAELKHLKSKIQSQEVGKE